MQARQGWWHITKCLTIVTPCLKMIFYTCFTEGFLFTVYTHSFKKCVGFHINIKKGKGMRKKSVIFWQGF